MSGIYSQVYEKYKKWIFKKEKTINRNKLALFSKTIDIGIRIVSVLDETEDTDIFRSLYHISKQMKSTCFPELYTRQLELAISDKGQFLRGLHDFYSDTARTIKKGQVLEQFFQHLRETQTSIDRSITPEVLTAYEGLVIGQLNYLVSSPDSTPCGCTTNGELMIVKNPFPESLPIEIELSRSPKGINACVAYNISRRYGMSIDSEADLLDFIRISGAYVSQVYTLRPFLDEYNYDILPSPEDVRDWRKSQNPFLFDAQLSTCDWKSLIAGLEDRRRRTLPTNGVLIHFDSEDGEFPVRKVLLKEAIYLDGTILLCKVETSMGFVAGYYNIRKKYLEVSSPLTMHDKQFHIFFENVVLYLYASLVGPKRGQFKKEIYQHLRFFKVIDKDSDLNTELPYTVKFQPLGEERQVTYQAGGMKKTVSEERKDLYETGTTKIAPYVRHLPAGKMRSPAASAAAKRLGLDLRPNETFVASHFKSVRRLKQTKSSKVEIASWI